MDLSTYSQIPQDFDSIDVFPWNTNFETGIRAIDDQHKQLVCLLNKLAGTLVSPEPVEVKNAFDELTEYAKVHFAFEETFWAKHFGNDYWFSSHQISHAAFLPKVVEINERDEHVPLINIVENVVRFLIRWLAFHIIDEDMRMALCIQELEAGKQLSEAKMLAEEKMSGSMRVLIETILSMYDEICSTSMTMLRERSARMKTDSLLREALSELKVLEGILPICAHCKCIRSADGTWNQLESYIDQNSEAEFTHGICPECTEQYHPDLTLG